MKKAAKKGRPKGPQRPKPVSWRPKTQEARDRYFKLGGAPWFHFVVDETPLPKGKK